MYKQNIYKVLSNTALTKDVYKMILAGDTQYITAPGQFINIKLDGKFLRRPISVCDYDEKSITIIYKVVGEGTAQMKNIQPGESLDILTGLGNGYDISKSSKPLLIGGGVGVPPMYNLAKALIVDGQKQLLYWDLIPPQKFFMKKNLWPWVQILMLLLLTVAMV